MSEYVGKYDQDKGVNLTCPDCGYKITIHAHVPQAFSHCSVDVVTCPQCGVPMFYGVLTGVQYTLVPYDPPAEFVQPSQPSVNNGQVDEVEIYDPKYDAPGGTVLPQDIGMEPGAGYWKVSRHIDGFSCKTQKEMAAQLAKCGIHLDFDGGEPEPQGPFKLAVVRPKIMATAHIDLSSEADMEPDDYCDLDTPTPTYWRIGFMSGSIINVQNLDDDDGDYVACFEYLNMDRVEFVIPVYKLDKENPS